MISNQILNKSNWFTKLSVSFLSITLAINLFLYFTIPLLPFLLRNKAQTIGLIVMGFSVLFSIIFPIYWHWKEKSGIFNSEKYHIWLTTLLRYCLASTVIMFGFEKFMGINFHHTFYTSDTPVGLLNGQQLTWIYFGYSYGLSVVVAIFQILGSILLLYRRTILIGLTLLLPIQLNILLINIFYKIGLVIITAVLIVLGLVYLLYQRKNEIIDLFKNFSDQLPLLGTTTFRNSARVLTIVLPVLMLTYFKSETYTSSKYFGKWKVESMKRNGKLIDENAWKKDTLAWKTVYFEERGELLFTPNPYIYDDNTSIYMNYDYDDTKDALRVLSYEKNQDKPDTIPVNIRNFKKNSMEWNMVFYNDTIQMNLKKVR
ncbi:MAG: hypothetical protein QM535_16850 [Limnohabitans sp.]|nr:hypothetical protein [Limnohabitans sp.]